MLESGESGAIAEQTVAREHEAEQDWRGSDGEPEDRLGRVPEHLVDDIEAVVLGEDEEDVQPGEEASEPDEYCDEELDLVDLEGDWDAWDEYDQVADQGEEVAQHQGDVPEGEDLGVDLIVAHSEDFWENFLVKF